MSDAFKPILAALAAGARLTAGEADAFFSACLRGEPTPAQIASALTAMRVRGETVEEITACARAMRRSAVPFDPGCEVIDTCGTGGDSAHTYNISTAAAFVAAGGGLKVAKHGGRAVSSRSGSVEVLAALGVRTDMEPDAARRALDEAGLCFLNATTYHGAMRHVAPVRAELGFRTLFNLLGPLSNPAGAKRQVVGVYDPARAEPMARVLGELGAERAWVVHGAGLDEITTAGESAVVEWCQGDVRTFTLTPEDVGLLRVDAWALRGGDAAHNAQALRALLEGRAGSYRDIVLFNAAAAFVVADRAESLSHGVEVAARSIDSGAALGVLESLITLSETP